MNWMQFQTQFFFAKTCRQSYSPTRCTGHLQSSALGIRVGPGMGCQAHVIRPCQGWQHDAPTVATNASQLSECQEICSARCAEFSVTHCGSFWRQQLATLKTGHRSEYRTPTSYSTASPGGLGSWEVGNQVLSMLRHGDPGGYGGCCHGAADILPPFH